MREKPGVRTHILLVVAMAVIIAVVTGLSLLLIRHHLRDQVTGDLSEDLGHSVVAFKNLQAERLRTLEHENELLSQLPTLKALMTSGDDLTIQNEAAEFWRLSGADLFVLADPSGRVVAGYTNSAAVDASLRAGVKALLASPDKHYLIDGGSLYACSLRPLYFGNDQDGTLLGYVVSGVSIERTVREISQPIGAEAAFLSGGQVVASTLRCRRSGESGASISLSFGNRPGARFGDAGRRALSLCQGGPLCMPQRLRLQLVVMKSFEPAERTISDINRMVMIVGLLALLSGTASDGRRFAAGHAPARRALEKRSCFCARRCEAHRFRATARRRCANLVRPFRRCAAKSRKPTRRCWNRSGWQPLAAWQVRYRTICGTISPLSTPMRSFSRPTASLRKSAPRSFGEIRAAVGGTTEMLESLADFQPHGRKRQASARTDGGAR